MLAIALFGHWLDIATNPLVLAAPIGIALWTGRRWAVRLGTIALATAFGAVAASDAEPLHAAGLIALAALAGAVVAEIWLWLVLPLAMGVARVVRRWVRRLRGDRAA